MVFIIARLSLNCHLRLAAPGHFFLLLTHCFKFSVWQKERTRLLLYYSVNKLCQCQCIDFELSILTIQ